MAPGISDFVRNIFGPKKAGPSAVEPDAAVDYKGYSIRPSPRQQGSQWTTEGVIAKQFPDGEKECRFIRADTHGEKTDALASCVAKAKRIIDEQGDQMFGSK
ncbi:MAG: hypothetical protein HY246_04585 [Proteobacteria bacterium]|nr:hypothetical protein [Pseudomonadota bacterium]